MEFIPPTAPKNETIEAAEIRSRQNAEEMQGLDPDTLDKKMHYRWAHVRPQRLARLKAKGYKLVSRSKDGVRTALDDDQGGEEDTIRQGDMVLMQMPMEKFVAERSRVRKVGNARLAAPKQQFRKKAGANKVDVVDRPDKHDRS